MPVVFFDTNALYIQGYRDSFVAGSLTADYTPIGVGVRVLHGSDYLVNDTWPNYERQDGSGFTSPDDLMAYLTAQFAMRRPVGSPERNYALPSASGQPVFSLSPQPVDVNTVALVVNGVSYYPPDTAVSSLAVTWQGPFPLEPTDALRVAYF